MLDFNKRLKELRKTEEITQKQLGQIIGLSTSHIQSYELSKRKPSYFKLIALADYFDVSIDYLVGRSDDPERR